MPVIGTPETRTDAQGRFVLTVPAKAKVLAVLPREFRPEFRSIAAAGDQSLEIVLREGHTARGRVMDEDGRPVKGVDVTPSIQFLDGQVTAFMPLMEQSAVTDEKGRFVVKGVPEESFFCFQKRGMTELRQGLELDTADYKSIGTMQYGGAISGRVVDREGKPIRSFRVLVNGSRGGGGAGVFAGFTGIGVRFTSADGSFVLTDVPAGGAYRITALAEGHDQAVADPVKAVPLNHLADAKPVTLQAGPPARLRVRAVTGDGKPVAGARVTLVNCESPIRRFHWGYDDASWSNMVRGRTDLDGWAEFPALGFNEGMVLVQAAGFARRHVPWEAGREVLTVPLPAEAVVTGEVRDVRGEVVSTIYVKMDSEGDLLSAKVKPEDNGRFRIGELPAGTWSLIILGGEGGRDTLHQEKITVGAGETKEVRIRLKK
jgi:hypothetical protein